MTESFTGVFKCPKVRSELPVYLLALQRGLGQAK